jgi:hypothetical protein
MDDETRNEETKVDPPAPRPRLRPAGVFRAVVLGALAALPAAGCFESTEAYGVPYDAGDTADATDAVDAEDGTADDFTDAVLPPYMAPDYGVPEP